MSPRIIVFNIYIAYRCHYTAVSYTHLDVYKRQVLHRPTASCAYPEHQSFP